MLSYLSAPLSGRILSLPQIPAMLWVEVSLADALAGFSDGDNTNCVVYRDAGP